MTKSAYEQLLIDSDHRGLKYLSQIQHLSSAAAVHYIASDGSLVSIIRPVNVNNGEDRSWRRPRIQVAFVRRAYIPSLL